MRGLPSRPRGHGGMRKENRTETWQRRSRRECGSHARGPFATTDDAKPFSAAKGRFMLCAFTTLRRTLPKTREVAHFADSACLPAAGKLRHAGSRTPSTWLAGIVLRAPSAEGTGIAGRRKKVCGARELIGEVVRLSGRNAGVLGALLRCGTRQSV
jgi:hypothetical protein